MKLEITKQLINELQSISRTAGAEILKVYQCEDFDVQQKNDDSPLTRADTAANKIICEGLRRLTPDIPIISEENTIPPYNVRNKYKLYWLIDPLDGTKEFIKRNGDFTTNIALISDCRSVLGMVFVPDLDQLYWAAEGMGAHKIVEGESKPIRVRSFNAAEKGLTITCSRSHLNEDTRRYISQYNEPILDKVGSSLKLMRIAEGKADIYPRLGPISEWDIAASHIIVEEAGGSVLQYPDQTSICYNKENLLMPYFVVEGKRL